ncbi:tether containing UBX domain for GLUT4 isoform X3 [Pipistrellus kuhlii]|uniref:tether containing UBX domain for GLUT4 isoform X3 n=1 Tax=Pipistrellus kuhlii TaxID=59472 RepID=UPI001E27362B|nr:tether containing UBX domain for GLUT4 isoform X3 [Pipistrellus kuhlii]
MAASASGGGSAVSVLAPNGRRHTVKVTPSTVLLQVLEDTCRRQDFNPSEYDLKFQRNVLDLSLQWRFANLPNNAKLEMVPASRSREGPGNTVRVALQLDDGSRLQGAFCSGQTLWELLGHFAQTRACLEQPCEASPVCVYMRDEVTGRAALQSTTLLSLGLTGGSAIIRFAMRSCDSAATQQPGGSRSGSPASPTPSPAAEQASGPLLPAASAGLGRGDVSRRDTAGPLAAGSAEEPPAKHIPEEPRPPPFVPFSGGGQRLGGPCGSSRCLTAPAAKLPKSFSSPGGPSKPKKSRPPPEPEPPVDRDPVVCHPDLGELLQAWPAELPDEFFEVTVDDVRRRLAQLKSERKRLEEAPLVTKAFREAQMKEKLERYPKVVLRVLFPDRYILQGFFRPSETVGDLRDFVRSHLGNPELPFHLFITPPKTILEDHTLTLFQANLFPAALVHFGAEEPAGLYLEPKLLEHTVSPSAADVLVTRCMSRTSVPPSPLPAPDPVPLESEAAAEEGARAPPEPSPGTVQPLRRDLGKVPKWLKLPGHMLHCSQQEVSRQPEVPIGREQDLLLTRVPIKTEHLLRDPVLSQKGPQPSPGRLPTLPTFQAPGHGLQPGTGQPQPGWPSACQSLCRACSPRGFASLPSSIPASRPGLWAQAGTLPCHPRMGWQPGLKGPPPPPGHWPFKFRRSHGLPYCRGAGRGWRSGGWEECRTGPAGQVRDGGPGGGQVLVEGVSSAPAPNHWTEPSGCSRPGHCRCSFQS